jgi:PAS domain S-box-containing protein
MVEGVSGAHPSALAEWVVRAVPDGLWVVDEQGRTVYANERMAELVGVEPGRITDYDLTGSLDPDALALFREHRKRQRAGAGALTEEVEVCLQRREGGEFWALVRYSPMLDDEGVLRGWVHRVSDHTEQRQLLEESRRRAHQLAEAQEIAHIGSWDHDLVTLRADWSEETYRLCGVDPETFVPTPESFFERLHPDDRQVAVEAFERMLAGSDSLEFEARVVLEGGPPRWVQAQGIVTRDRDGTPLRMGGTLQDVTAAKENELGLGFLSAMAAAANEARTLEEVLNAAEKHVIPYAQWPAVLVAAPYPPGSESLWFIDVAWADHPEEVRLFARDLARRAGDAQGTLVEIGPGGTALVAGAVVYDGRLAAVIVSDSLDRVAPRPSDLTIFDQMLAFLARVAEREWAAEELAAARDQALSASRAKSDFLATMSHEIRTPLNGVIGLSELLRRTDLTAHQQRLAAGVDQAGRTLLALVNDILDLSKIEAGRLDLEEVDFDPRDILEQSVGLVADKAREKGLELVLAGSPDLPSQVRGDPVRFGQVITNLAANAVKFTAEGEVVVRATGQGGPDGSELRVEVSDTGVGVDEEAQGRLFEAFSQADSSTTREYGGTGLGLAISKKIVTAMDGDIGVHSQVGVGSTFWFTASFAAPLGEDPRPDTERENAIAGLRVLVVDDNETNRFILAEQLSAWQVEITVVESAYEALVELDASIRLSAPYDIVLLDYMMPGADGEQLARIVRAEQRHARSRLVLLSSGVEPPAEWLADLGIDMFLNKPVLPSRLLDVLATLGGRMATAVVKAVDPDAATRPGRGRVLVVEDNSVNQLVAEGVLRRLGYDVVLADNGAAGVAALADDPDGFDAILMDCQMPVMDGFDATRAVRAMQRGSGARTPIIAMTAAAIADERERCLEAGMDDFLSKPVDVGLLETTLDRWVPALVAVVPEVSSVPDAPDASPAARRLRELIERDGIPPELVARMIERFSPTAAATAEEIVVAARAGDPAEVARRAHSLRGSAATLGLTTLADVCERIELPAADGELPSDERLGDLAREVARAVTELADFARTGLG